MSGRQGRKRLAADLPRNWLTELPYFGLSYEAWWMHTRALMWATGETNGLIPDDTMPILMPRADWDSQRKTAAELVKAGLWARVTGGWQVRDWEDSQSTVAQIEANRAAARKRMARHRASQRDAKQAEAKEKQSRPPSYGVTPETAQASATPGQSGYAVTKVKVKVKDKEHPGATTNGPDDGHG